MTHYHSNPIQKHRERRGLRDIIDSSRRDSVSSVLKSLIVSIMLTTLLVSCSKDEASSAYSRREYVYANLYVPTYIELYNTLGNPGQFVTLRKTTVTNPGGMMQTILEVSNSQGTGQYAIDKIMMNFAYGLGGLIVGTNYYMENLCYDLSCPYCDRSNRRLNLSDNGIARCPKCGISYDMNNYGVIHSIDTTQTYNNSMRGLYRYRIMYNGTYCSVYN